MNKLFQVLGMILLLLMQSISYAVELKPYPLSPITEGLSDDSNANLSKYSVGVVLKPNIENQRLEIIFPKNVALPFVLKTHIIQILEKIDLDSLPKTVDEDFLRQVDQYTSEEIAVVENFYSAYSVSFNFLPIRDALHNKITLRNRQKICSILQNYDVFNQNDYFVLQYILIVDDKGMRIQLDGLENLELQYRQLLESSLSFPKKIRIFDLNSQKYVSNEFPQKVIVECK